MPRYISWLVIGVAAAYLVVATATFSLSTTASLAFAISIGTPIVSAAVSYRYRNDVATLTTGLVTAIVSGWTIVASLVFSLPTVTEPGARHRSRAGGLSIAGMTEHEPANERAAESSTSRDEHEPHLSAAA